jgi:hypothetical protein
MKGKDGQLTGKAGVFQARTALRCVVLGDGLDCHGLLLNLIEYQIPQLSFQISII